MATTCCVLGPAWTYSIEGCCVGLHVLLGVHKMLLSTSNEFLAFFFSSGLTFFLVRIGSKALPEPGNISTQG
jgi:hypothetical protein